MSAFGRYTIVGFDLRKKPLLDLQGPKPLGAYWPTDHPQPFPYPPTISAQTWPQSESVEALRHPDTNGVNLFFLPDIARRDADAISVAFSMRADDAKAFHEKSWILPIEEGFLSSSLGWRLLGWDVADGFLGHSVFYGFTWQPGELREMLGEIEVMFNRFGLLDDEAAARAIAAFFSSERGVRGHAPFYPVRVWIQD